MLIYFNNILFSCFHGLFGVETIKSRVIIGFYCLLLVVQKDAMVADMWNWVREEGGWSPIFLRSFNDWEMEEEVERFLFSIHRKKIRPDLGLRANFC